MIRVEPMMTVCEAPAGTYPIGDGRYPISRPAHRVNLPAFAIAQTTVTNVEFLNFVAAGGYQEPRYWSEMGWHWQEGKKITKPFFFYEALFNPFYQPIFGGCLDGTHPFCPRVAE